MTYIHKLHKEKLENHLKRKIATSFPNYEVFYEYVNPFSSELTLKKNIEGDLISRIYCLTDFDCYLSRDMANNAPKSESEFCDVDEKVKKAYITSMASLFRDYKEEYLKETETRSQISLI